jgi:hypothetical protein
MGARSAAGRSMAASIAEASAALVLDTVAAFTAVASASEGDSTPPIRFMAIAVALIAASTARADTTGSIYGEERLRRRSSSSVRFNSPAIYRIVCSLPSSNPERSRKRSRIAPYSRDRLALAFVNARHITDRYLQRS